MLSKEDIAAEQQAAAHKEQQESIDVRRITTLNGLAEAIGRQNKKSGFREDWESTRNLAGLSGFLAEWMQTVVEVQADDTEVTLSQMLKTASSDLAINIIGMKLALIQSEISEALESLRLTGVENIHSQGNFVEELADAMIRIFDVADMVNGDIGKALVDKMAVNAARPYKHGKKV